MKRILVCLMVLGLALSVVGCGGKATTGNGDNGTDGTELPSIAAAGFVGDAASESLEFVTGDLIDAFRSSSNPTCDLQTKWWSASKTSTNVTTTTEAVYHFKVWDKDGLPITDDQVLDAITTSLDEISTQVDKIQTYSVVTTEVFAKTDTRKFGSSATEPLTFDYASGKIDGPVTYTTTYTTPAGSYDITTILVYPTSLGYTLTPPSLKWWPTNEAAATFTITAAGIQDLAGTLEFDGTYTATLRFTTGSTDVYEINLVSGSPELVP